MSESLAFGLGLGTRTNTGVHTHTHTGCWDALRHTHTHANHIRRLSHIAFCPLSEIVFIYSSVHSSVHSMTHYGYSVLFKQERGESDPSVSCRWPCGDGTHRECRLWSGVLSLSRCHCFYDLANHIPTGPWLPLSFCLAAAVALSQHALPVIK